MLLKVISTKTVFGDKEKILETVMTDKNTAHLLYRIFGEITGYAIGKGKHKRVNRETGEAEDTFWTKFMGDFRAVSAETGDIHESSTAFIPDYVSSQFVTALKDDAEDQGLSIAFAYDIYARFNRDSITSYEFIAVPVKKKGDENRLKKMTEELAAMPVRQLTGPEKGGKHKG